MNQSASSATPSHIWSNRLTMVFTAVTAMAAVGAVYVGSKQVDAAVDAVARAEQTKFISEFVAGADDVCRELIPPMLRESVRYKSQANSDGTVARPTYFLPRGISIDPNDVKKSWQTNITELTSASNKLSNKARMLVVWNKGSRLDYDIYTFSLQLVHRSLDEARGVSQVEPYIFMKAREICEGSVDRAVAQYMK